MPELASADEISIGVDIGGTKVLGGVVNRRGEILATARRDTPPQGGRDLTLAIAEVARELIEKYPVKNIGISAAGFISSDRKTILATPNIKGWNGVNLQIELSELIGNTVVIENDGNAAGWGEFVFGAAKAVQHMLMVTVGTGIGGGIVIDGQMLRGGFGIGGEIGHLRLVPDGHKCGCGAHGCFEQYASGTALMRHTKSLVNDGSLDAKQMIDKAGGSLENLKGHHITELARSGNSLALKAFSITGEYLGAGIASLCAVLDPEMIVIGGGVVEAGSLILEPAIASMKAHMPFSGMHPFPQVVLAELGNDAGLIGAADLALR